MESYHFCFLILFCATGFAEDSQPANASIAPTTIAANVSMDMGNDTITQPPSNACDDIQCQADEECILLNNGKPFCESVSAVSPTCAGVRCRDNQLCVPRNGTAFCVSKRITTVILPTLCKPNPCLNGGQCVAIQELLISTCRCVEGFYGVICGNTILELCTPNPCHNDGVCSVENFNVLCDCGQGWKGEVCEIPDVCNPNPCLNSGTCTVINDLEMTCTCPIGWKSEFCDVQDLCNPDPCRNGGECTQINDNQMICTCLSGWKGVLCQENDLCNPNPCQNGGSCAQISDVKLECTCPDGWKGEFCQEEDLCNPNPCQNGGECTEILDVEQRFRLGGKKTLCTCPTGWKGLFCQEKDLCNPNPCQNGGSCAQISDVKLECTCPDGWKGEFCQEEDLCNPNPCQNGGECTEILDVEQRFRLGGKKTRCTCPTGWKGLFCQEKDLCNPNQCQNGGSCAQISDVQLECTCSPGWKGEYCEIMDVCHPNPCENDGSCVEINDLQFECTCPLGWKGLTCDVLNDPCSPSPCQNDGACSTTIDFEPECTCTEQWTGEFCEVPSVCSPNPCKNQCECRPSCKHEFGYICVNSDGFIGKNCDIAIPRVSCGPSEIVIDVSTDFFDEFDSKIRNSFVYIAPNNDNSQAKGDDRCKAIQEGTDMRLTLPLPFNDCGTMNQQAKSGTDDILFKNRLWINRAAEGGRIEMPVPVIDFECHYSRRYSVVTSLQPVLDQGSKVRRFGNFDIAYGLCKMASCPTAECPKLFRVGENGRSAVYTVGQSIHFSMNVNTKQSTLFRTSLVSTLESMFLSCSSDPTQPGFVTFSEDGCPTEAFFDVAVSSGMIDNPEKICVSFQVPRVKIFHCNTFYIHANVRLCDKGELMACEGSGVLKCSPAARRRRDLSGDANTTSVAIVGPISILPGQQGVAVETLYLDDGYGSVMTIANELRVENDQPVTTKTEQSKKIDNCTIFYIVGAISLGIFSMTVLIYLTMKLTTRHSRKNDSTIKAGTHA